MSEQYHHETLSCPHGLVFLSRFTIRRESNDIQEHFLESPVHPTNNVGVYGSCGLPFNVKRRGCLARSGTPSAF